MKLLVRTLFVLLIAILSNSPTYAQFRGGVVGTVADPSGGTISNASVTLTSLETQRKLETTSNESGAYQFSSLSPGQYQLVVSQPGFKETSLQLAVSAEAVATANVTLTPGDVAESVTVTEDSSPAVETTNGDVSRALTTQEIVRLPQVGRNPYELIRLTPGIFGDAARSGNGQSVALPNTSGPGGSNLSLFQTENQVPISANGQRVSANNYLIDGVSVNSLGYGGAAVVTPNQESVKEVRVNANAYSAEYGRNSGAQIETVTQNGTDKFHGSAVFLFQDPNFNAYNRPSILSIPVTRVDNAFHNYAGSLGGPLVKNHLFFFFSTELIHNSSTSYSNQYIETPQFDAAVLAQRPGTIAAKVIGTAGDTPRVIAVIPQTACPTTQPNCQIVNGQLDLGRIGGTPGTYLPFGSGGGSGGPDGVPDVERALIGLPEKDSGQQYNGRLDWSRGKDYIAGSTYMTYLDRTAASGAAGGRPNADARITPVNSAVTAIYTRTLSPTMINEARANFTRFSFNQLQSSKITDYGIPAIQIQFQGIGGFQYGADQGQSTPAAFAQNTYEFRDTLSKVAGNHQIRAGFEMRREQDNNNLVGAARPVYAIQDLWNFANDAPVYENINANPNTGAPSSSQLYFRTNVYAAFVQDSWKVRPDLTLNLGLRWEDFTPPTEKRGQLYGLQLGPGYGNLAQATIQHRNELFNNDLNNFAPRFGFAYNPSSSKFVMRGGFGVMFNRVPDTLFDLTREASPTYANFGLCCGTAASPYAGGTILYELGTSNSIFSYPANPALATGIDPVTNTPRAIGGKPNQVEIYTAPTNFATPYVYVYSLETDYTFAKDFVATLAFQGSTSHKLVQLVNLNFLYPQPASNGQNTFSAVYNITPQVNANYNGLIATLSKRLSSGVQFQQNFRWSKSIDTNSYEGPSANTNSTYPIDTKQDRGLSDFDTKYNYTASGLYELPFYRTQKGFWGKLLGGFEVNPIYTFHTGFPWTPKTGQSIVTPSGVGLSPIRPYAYLGGALTGQSNTAFLRPNGNFPGGGAKYFLYTLPAGVTTVPPGIGRNVFRGPWYQSIDFSVGKFTKLPNRWLGEATQLETRINLFNAFNQRNFAPFNYGDPSTFVDNPQFGQPLSELSGRTVELQARFSF